MYLRLVPGSRENNLATLIFVLFKIAAFVNLAVHFFIPQFSLILYVVDNFGHWKSSEYKTSLLCFVAITSHQHQSVSVSCVSNCMF